MRANLVFSLRGSKQKLKKIEFSARTEREKEVVFPESSEKFL